jgi:7-carboxy-7-deazaguanine synthase
MKVREIFYSLQGEGSRAGEASIFVRLANCNLDCWFCDTDWSFGETMTIEEIEKEISQYKSKWIIWTGGEPTLQLTEEIVNHFKALGYLQAIETNGTNPVPQGIDYITCSPKVNAMFLKSSLKLNKVNEIRYPIGINDPLPPAIEKLPKSDHYFVSPLFLGEEKKRFDLDFENLEFCINFVKDNPEWKLSTQQQKIWKIR